MDARTTLAILLLLTTCLPAAVGCAPSPRGGTASSEEARSAALPTAMRVRPMDAGDESGDRTEAVEGAVAAAVRDADERAPAAPAGASSSASDEGVQVDTSFSASISFGAPPPELEGLPRDPCELLSDERASEVLGTEVSSMAMGAGYGCSYQAGGWLVQEDAGPGVTAFFVIYEGDEARRPLLDGLARFADSDGCRIGGSVSTDPSFYANATPLPPEIEQLRERSLAELSDMYLEEARARCLKEGGMMLAAERLEGIGDFASLQVYQLFSMPLPTLQVVRGDRQYQLQVLYPGDEAGRAPMEVSLELLPEFAAALLDLETAPALAAVPTPVPLPTPTPCHEPSAGGQVFSAAQREAIHSDLSLEHVRELLEMQGEPLSVGERIRWEIGEESWSIPFEEGRVAGSADWMGRTQDEDGATSFSARTDAERFPVGTEMAAIEAELGAPASRVEQLELRFRDAHCSTLTATFIDGEIRQTMWEVHER